MTLLVMGCDPHLDSITVAVIDTNGTQVDGGTVPNTRPGWDSVVEVCTGSGITRVGIEGASGYGRRLAETLTDARIAVFEVPTRVTSRTRRIDGAGKTDPGDARTIARAVHNGHATKWNNDTELEAIGIVSRRRDALVAQQTDDINQLRALLVKIDPEHAARLPRIRSVTPLRALADLTDTASCLTDTVTMTIRSIAATCIKRHQHITQLTEWLHQHLPPVGEALLAINGCGVVTAAQLLTHIAGTDHFATVAQLAAWNGTAPLDASSGRQQRHRLNRGGNRHVNRALHTIITTQIRNGGEAHDYVTRRIQEGKTRREATRACKRHLNRRIWKILRDHGYTPN